jgi:hypothetical protein
MKKQNTRPGFTRLASPGSAHEAIATKAYALWVRRGYPDNQSDAIWLAAERELTDNPRKTPRVPALWPVSF